ncbi:autotransporter outer membrane beta-barrel domain-containing protein [Parasutterella secunda]|uniref:autotransporter outer membrane beta-barrel domain-containing protein n=1 Tax=Parasutterella secunda TaxID=626947 RepID=UPI002011F06B|nr:autotransporter outer membrane beta-barrel domain-containing protein [Parasutterella secunda]MCL1596963.1 autotransporter outer membrane beta-barrel domain-containing protein [Parasutterella secunda]
MFPTLKPSALALAVSMVLPVAQAVEFDVTTGVDGVEYGYAGIFNPASDFVEDVVIIAKDVPNDITWAYGYRNQTGKANQINGNLFVSIENLEKDPGIFGVRIQNGSSLTVGGDTFVTSKTSSTQSVGILAFTTGTILDLSHGNTVLNVASHTGRVMGIDIEQSSKAILGKAEINLNASGKATSGTRWIQGLYGAGGNIEVKDDIVFNVTTYNNNQQLVDSGTSVIRVINLEGSAYSTNAQFNKNLNIVVNANAQEALGIYVSGDKESTSDLHAGVNIDGQLGIDIQGAFDSAVGIYAQGESGVSTNQANISIHSTKSEGSVYGIYSTANPDSYPGPGYVNVENGLTVDVHGKGQTVGILSIGSSDDNRASLVNVGGATDINVISDEGSAIGVAVQEGATSTLHNVIANVQSQAADGKAIGLDLSSADVTLLGNHTISVEGSSSIGINAADTVLDINGSAVVTSDTAMVSDAKSVISVAGDDEVARLVLNGNVSNEGILKLDNATMSVNDTTEEVTLGTINTIGSKESTVELSAGTYDIKSFNGENKTLLLNDLANTQSVTIAKKTGDLRMVASAHSNDQYANAQAAAEALKDTIVITEDEAQAQNSLDVQAGDVNDALTAELNRDGSLSNVRIVKNDKLDAFGSVAALSAMSLRHEMNSLSKRMGDLRDAPEGVGVWMRGYGSEMEYGAQDLKMRSKSVQFGTDQSVGDWKLGVAFTYTDGDTSYDLGSADTKGYGVALYGTWFVPCGAYIDLMAKYNRLENDFKLNGMDGDYNSNAYGVSVETGYRFEFMDGGLYLEPQVGLNYGHIEGETIKTSNNVRIDQDSYDSLIGRAGLRAGFKFPKDKGTIYARLSGLYDFDGEVNGTATKGVAHNTIEEDLGGAWVEMGVGANFNWTPNTYTYIDFERTNGGDVKENYRWNVGIRHTF